MPKDAHNKAAVHVVIFPVLFGRGADETWRHSRDVPAECSLPFSERSPTQRASSH